MQQPDSRTQVVEAARRAERAAKEHPPVYVTSLEAMRELPAIAARSPNVETGHQRALLLEALLRFPDGITARDVTRLMDYSDGRARVRDLRELGYEIRSIPVRQIGSFGLMHKTVLYRLIARPTEKASP